MKHAKKSVTVIFPIALAHVHATRDVLKVAKTVPIRFVAVQGAALIRIWETDVLLRVKRQ